MTFAPDGGTLTPARPVLFLDVDGVLNDEPYFRHRDRAEDRDAYGMIDLEKIALLNEVVRRSGCIIVMSSSWREDSAFRAKFLARGASVEFHPDWRTKRVHDYEPNLRGREIAEWLDRHPTHFYAIVDDDNDMLPEQRDRFVQTNFDAGMTREHAERLIALLKPVEDALAA